MNGYEAVRQLANFVGHVTAQPLGGKHFLTTVAELNVIALENAKG